MIITTKNGGGNLNSLKLKAKRVEKNITQRSIAKALQTTPKTYCFKELGRTQFNVDEISQLIKILDLTTDEVMCIFFES